MAEHAVRSDGPDPRELEQLLVEALAALRRCRSAITEELLAADDLDHPVLRAHADAADQAAAVIAKVERRTPRVALRVGDLVDVGRASGINPANARGVVVEHYWLKEHGVARDGWTLLFENGGADGFSPQDCALFNVRKVGHEPQLADYRFISMTRLARDVRDGVFQGVWRRDRRDVLIDPRD
jgi:hypothetical protein